MVCSFIAVPGTHYTIEPQQTNVVDFQECLPLKNHHVCVVSKVEGPFIRLSRPNQVKNRVMNANKIPKMMGNHLSFSHQHLL